jgi:hypothetical protein
MVAGSGVLWTLLSQLLRAQPPSHRQTNTLPTTMDLQNELGLLQSATDISGKTARAGGSKKSKGKAPAPPVGQSLDALLSQLQDLRQKLVVDGELSSSNVTDDDFKTLSNAVEEKRKDVDERQKEVYASLTRMGKLLDKVCF